MPMLGIDNVLPKFILEDAELKGYFSLSWLSSMCARLVLFNCHFCVVYLIPESFLLDIQPRLLGFSSRTRIYLSWPALDEVFLSPLGPSPTRSRIILEMNITTITETVIFIRRSNQRLSPSASKSRESVKFLSEGVKLFFFIIVLNLLVI